MDPVWEDLHATRAWGKYPADHLIRTVMRAYWARDDRESAFVLELGCGAGANLSFFLAEGFQVYGVDGSPSAIKKCSERLTAAPGQTLDLSAQRFDTLDIPKDDFDLIVDYFAIYANRLETIRKTYANAKAMLKSGGMFYSRVWGTGCTGAATGLIVEPGTSQNPTAGPCKDMGMSHFFTKEELVDLFSDWQSTQITRVLTEEPDGSMIEEFVIWAKN